MQFGKTAKMEKKKEMYDRRRSFYATRSDMISINRGRRISIYHAISKKDGYHGEEKIVTFPRK